MVGQTISHYRIIEKLGEGGMGVVYRAEDLNLERPVALKFLTPHLVSDEEGRKRFIREAKAAAALDHPNICTVHEIGEADGRIFIAMAFLEGQPLSKRIAQGPLKLNEALSIAIQIAEGLEAAHAKGIVHRDIKPDNVMLVQGSRGLVKLMDFGLAQLSGSSKLTRGGSTLGTVFYMSPEQAQSADIDHRTDIWSLGVVLYEMVCGRPPFRGEFDQAVVYSLMNEAAEPLTAVRTGVPKELERIVNKCLAKAPAGRYQHADELLVDLRELQKEPSNLSQTKAMPAPAARSSRAPWCLGAAAAVVLLLFAAAFWFHRPGPPPSEPAEPLRAIPLTSDPGNEWHPAFSPDGTQVAFVWDGPARDNYDIYVQVVGSGGPLRLTTDPAADLRPVWSPDGRQIAFFRASAAGAAIYSIPPLGGAERRLVESSALSSAGLAWGPKSESLIFAEVSPGIGGLGLHQVVLESGEKKRLTSPPAAMPFGDIHPAVSPDGQTVAFVRGTTAKREIYLVPLSGGEPRELTSQGGLANGVAWTPDGRELVYSWVSSMGAARTLRRVAVAGGEPRSLAAFGQNVGSPAISLRGDRLAYEVVSNDINVWRYSLPTEKGAVQPHKVAASTWLDSEARISPNGNRIALSSNRSGNREIWTCDADGSNLLQLTSLRASSGSPRWSADGRRIAFDSDLKGNWDIYVVSAEGGSPRPLTQGQEEDSRPSWSRDGRWVYFGSNRSGSYQIWKVSPEGGDPVQVTRGGGYNPLESPDGRFLYFAKGPSVPELWRMPAEGGEESPMLQELVGNARWGLAANGVYFVVPSEGDRWMLRLVGPAGGEVMDVMDLPPPAGGPSLDISPDGRWFLYSQTDTLGSDLMLVENFK